MRALRGIAFCATATLALAACDWDGGVVIIDQPDTFDAVFLEIDDGVALPRDLIPRGARFELTLQEGPGTFQSDFEFDGVDLEVAGTYIVEDDRITFSDGPFDDDTLALERSYDVVMGTDVILIENGTAVFDIDNDGATEVVDIEVRLERRD